MTIGLRPSPLTALSGLLVVLALPPWDWGSLIWVALAPWLVAQSRAASPAAALAQGAWLSVFYACAGMFWLPHAVHEFMGWPQPVGWILLLLFSPLAQPQFVLFAAARFWASRRSTLNGTLAQLTLAAVYAGADYVAPKIFKEGLGHALYSSPYLRQAADLGGVSLLTFAVVAVNLLIVQVYRSLRVAERGYGRALRSRELGAALGILACLLLYGAYRRHETRRELENPVLRLPVAAIQTNVAGVDKLEAEDGSLAGAKEMLRASFALSDRALAASDQRPLLVWPETSYPSRFRAPRTEAERSLDDAMQKYVERRRVTLVFGGYDRVGEREANAVFFLGPGGRHRVYHKSLLLPFGESVPGVELFPALEKLLPRVGFFARGPGAAAIEILADGGRARVKAGPIICYEALSSAYGIDVARRGAQLIINLTNDSWFGDFGEPQLHLAFSVFRSIETRLPQVRVANTGISALILPDGEIAASTPVGRAEVLNVSVPILASSPTLLVRWGDWFGIFSAITGALGLLWLRRNGSSLVKV